MATAKAESEEDKLAAQDAFERFLEEAESDPIHYLKHDTRAHDDEALYRLTARLGMECYGRYWLLVELLTGRRHHYYDVSDELGWRRLSRDMSCICDMGVDECKSFIADLYGADLINREQYDELHRVTITRILVSAHEYAVSVATKKLGAWKTNRKKMFG